MSTAKKVQKRPKGDVVLDLSITKIFKEGAGGYKLAKIAKDELNIALNIIANKLVSIAIELANKEGKKTISRNHMVSSINSLVVVDNGGRLLYLSDYEADGFVKSARAAHFLRGKGKNVSKASTEVLAVFLTNLISTIIEDTVAVMNEKKVKTMSVKHMFEAITENEALCNLFKILEIDLGGHGTMYLKYSDQPDIKKGTQKKRKAVSAHIKSAKQSGNNLQFAKSHVMEIIKSSLLENVGEGIRVSEDSRILLQDYVENHLKKILKAADEIANHAGRTTVQLKDVKLAMKQSTSKC